MNFRPQEVADWGRKRDSIPSIVGFKGFHDTWLNWWSACQPYWRTTTKWPFPRDDDDDDRDWGRLDATGPYGLFAVVISASWCATSKNPNRADSDTVTADLHWVIERLLHSNFTESQPAPSKKRRRQ